MAFYQEGRKAGNFDTGIEMALARILASPKFIYRIEAEPGATVRTVAAQAAPAYRISDLDLASRLSFFLWSRGPDEELMKLASAGRLKDPAVLERRSTHAAGSARRGAGDQLRRTVAEPARPAEAMSPLPMLYPDFDDPLRQAMRREVELLFDSIVREDRNVVDLLTADYTFVNERLAKHYGIPNIYGSQFRRITLGPDMDVRKGLLGKARLPDDHLEARTNLAGHARQVDHDEHPRDEPAGPAGGRATAAAAPRATGNAKEPSMRQKMMSHRVRADCIQCHSLMDPIGFALENFDGIAQWRTEDEGNPVDPVAEVFDGTKIDGPVGLRNWLVNGYYHQFRRGRDREASHLRAGPWDGIQGHAAGSRHRTRRRQVQLPVFGARPGRRQ